ncbi:MAG: hypothetical protein ABIL07_08185, partial [candidate division WOR-3 bacterium]
IGFVYNPGEAVLGTTTPLYTILLSILGYIFIPTNLNNLPILSLIVNAIADAINCVLLIAIGSVVGSKKIGYISASLWAISPFSVTFAIGGLETSLYVLCLVLTCYCYLTKRYPFGAFAASLALLTRPDALIFLGPIALYRVLKLILMKEKVNWLEIILFCLPIVSWSYFSINHFGDVLPHSIHAKLVAYNLKPYDGLIRLLQHYATPFLDENIGGKYSIMAGLVVYPFLYAIGLYRSFRTNVLLGVILAYPLFYLFTFAIMNPLIFRWYLTPPLPFYFFSILFGLEKLISDVTKALKPKPELYLLISIIIFTYPFVSTITEWTIKPDHGNQTPTPRMAFIKLELLYAEISDIILSDNHFNKNCVIAAGDVGVLGFLTGARILDTVGLNTPQSLKYYPIPREDYVINYAIPAKLILNEKPDYIVFPDIYGKNTILKTTEIHNSYEVIYSIPTTIYGSENLILMKRKTSKCENP